MADSNQNIQMGISALKKGVALHYERVLQPSSIMHYTIRRSNVQDVNIHRSVLSTLKRRRRRVQTYFTFLRWTFPITSKSIYPWINRGVFFFFTYPCKILILTFITWPRIGITCISLHKSAAPRPVQLNTTLYSGANWAKLLTCHTSTRPPDFLNLLRIKIGFF